MACTLLSLFGSGADLGAHVNVKGCKAFCFTKGPDSDAIRRAHEKLNFPFDSITEVKRVTGADLRPELTDASTRRHGATVCSTEYTVAPCLQATKMQILFF